MCEKKDINALDHYGITVLNLACDTSDVETVEQLIENGAEVNKSDIGWYSPLMTSAYKGKLDIGKVLINNGAKVNDFDDEGNTALNMAVKKYCNPNSNEKPNDDFYKVTDLLIMNKADINKSNLIGVAPLHQAILSGNERMTEFLIEKGADINQKTNLLDLSPIHLAAISGDLKVFDKIVKSGADINIKSKEGLTPIMYAKIFKQVDVANYLFKLGARIDDESIDENTILKEIDNIKGEQLEVDENDNFIDSDAIKIIKK